ncbi:precorrin-2 C(20)-methyltransferase, partial [Nitrospirota bacterium]
MKKGKLYAIGIGPGDPELLTLKAVRIIRESDVISVPRGKDKGESLALAIVEGAVDLTGKKILDTHFPMTKGSQRDALMPAAEEILGYLNDGSDVAFITLGDPVLYSTFFHLYDSLLALSPDVNVEIVPGVSSINAAGARAGVSLALASEKLAIVPATYMKDVRKVLEDFETVVLMKVFRVIDELSVVLKEMGLYERAIYVSRVGLDGEVVKPLSEIGEEELNYFSI